MLSTVLIFLVTSFVIISIFGFWLESKEKSKDINEGEDYVSEAIEEVEETETEKEDDKKLQNKIELDLNKGIMNEIIFKDSLDNFKNLKDDEIINAVSKFIQMIYLKELGKFSFDRSHLIDNYLNPTDNIRFLLLLENIRDGLKVTRDALLDQLDLDEFQSKILKMSFASYKEVEKPVLEEYLRLKKVKMLKDSGTLNKSSLKSVSNQTDSKPVVSPIAEYDNSIQNSLLLYKFIQTDKGTKPLVWSKTSTKMIGGVEVEVKEQPWLGDKLENSLFFYAFTQIKKGIVTSTEPLTGMKTSTKMIGGVEVQVRERSGEQGEVKFGYTAIKPEAAAQMNLSVGDELPLELTDKPVVDSSGEVIPNLFWAH